MVLKWFGRKTECNKLTTVFYVMPRRIYCCALITLSKLFNCVLRGEPESHKSVIVLCYLGIEKKNGWMSEKGQKKRMAKKYLKKNP